MNTAVPQTISRRNLLAGQPAAPLPEFRPPWTDEARVASLCTSCDACVTACPEQILRGDAKGRPLVDFQGGECTFCMACAKACEAGVFDLAQRPAWPVTIRLAASCLNLSQVACELCTDICLTEALKFDRSQTAAGQIRIDASACTGCGACIATCPVEALEISDERLNAA